LRPRLSKADRARAVRFRPGNPRWVALIIGVVLSGVGGLGAAPPARHNFPVSLDESELATIETALIADWHGGGQLELAKIIASENAQDAVIVCGFERAKVISGSNTGMQPFAGILTRRPWHFDVTASSNDGTLAPAVLAYCREHGLQLIPE
jgi:hypothetical protein